MFIILLIHNIIDVRNFVLLFLKKEPCGEIL